MLFKNSNGRFNEMFHKTALVLFNFYIINIGCLLVLTWFLFAFLLFVSHIICNTNVDIFSGVAVVFRLQTWRDTQCASPSRCSIRWSRLTVAVSTQPCPIDAWSPRLTSGTCTSSRWECTRRRAIRATRPNRLAAATRLTCTETTLESSRAMGRRLCRTRNRNTQTPAPLRWTWKPVPACSRSTSSNCYHRSSRPARPWRTSLPRRSPLRRRSRRRPRSRSWPETGSGGVVGASPSSPRRCASRRYRPSATSATARRPPAAPTRGTTTRWSTTPDSTSSTPGTRTVRSPSKSSHIPTCTTPRDRRCPRVSSTGSLECRGNEMWSVIFSEGRKCFI